MTEVDYSAGEENAPRDNAETEADAPKATAAQGEVDFTAPGGLHEPTGMDANILVAKAKVEAAWSDLKSSVEEYLGHVSTALKSAPEVPTNPTEAVPSPPSDGSPEVTPSDAVVSPEPVAPTTEPPAVQ